MATREPRTMRLALILLAAANLVALGIFLWPWQEALNLPVDGTAALDPAVTLLAYMVLLYWISSHIKASTQEALSSGALIGLAAGVIVVVRIVLAVRAAAQPGILSPALLGVAVILWGVAGLRGSKAAGSAGMGALSGLWSAMVSGLMACAAILSELYLSGPTQVSTDPWKQYQDLAFGNAATQGLVHTLNTATAFLVLGPLTGATVGLIFAFLGQNQKG